MDIALTAEVASKGVVECSLAIGSGEKLYLRGRRNHLVPKISGSHSLTKSRALVALTWSYGLHATLEREALQAPVARSHRRARKATERAIAWLAPRQVMAGDNSTIGWCSACLTKSNHRRINSTAKVLPVHLCDGCGTPTSQCSVPKCQNMAIRGTGFVKVGQFCGEHRREVPNFETTSQRLDDLADYRALLQFRCKNWAKGSKGLAQGAVIFAALWLAGETFGLEEHVAEVFDGADFSGADAPDGPTGDDAGPPIDETTAPATAGVSGVISLASEGLGGAAGLEAIVSNVRDDKRFDIEKLRDGFGPPVVVAKGFMTQRSQSWGPEMDSLVRQFPDSPIYRVHWGATAPSSWLQWVKVGLFPFSIPRRLILMLKANPWHRAYFRASQTGTLLALLLARTNGTPVVLVGHSLGARIMASCARTLGMYENGRRLHSVHLLGGAFPARGDWHAMSRSVQAHVWNYHSTRDPILKKLYRTAQMGSAPAGLVGVYSAMPRICNVDVSASVGGHTDYFKAINLRQPTPSRLRVWLTFVGWLFRFEWLRNARRVSTNERSLAAPETEDQRKSRLLPQQLT